MDVTQGQLLDLLELQKVDSTIDRLEGRRRNLPEQVELDQLEGRSNELQDSMAAHQAVVDEVISRQQKLEFEIEMIEAKINAEDAKLYAGKVTNPKELHSLQEEIESLKRRKVRTEDQDLEIMEEREAAESALAVFTDEQTPLLGVISEAVAKRDAAVVEIDAQLDVARAERETWLPRIDEELLKFYDELRSSKGGVGAAALVGDTCQGCHMKLPAQEIQRVRAATGLVRCDECRRILVVL